MLTGSRKWNVGRHEGVKWGIAQALKTLPDVQVETEPLILGTLRRDYIRFTGSPACGLGSENIDVAVISLSSKMARTVIHRAPHVSEGQSSPLDRTLARVELVLDKKAKDKRKKHLDDSIEEVSPFPFRRFILSAGGLAEKDTQEALKMWKKALPSFSYSHLLDRIGITLLRARGKGFQG